MEQIKIDSFWTISLSAIPNGLSGVNGSPIGSRAPMFSKIPTTGNCG